MVKKPQDVTIKNPGVSDTPEDHKSLAVTYIINGTGIQIKNPGDHKL